MNQTASNSAPTPQAPIAVLSYEQRDTGPRPRWVHAVVTVYLVLLAALLTLPVWGSWLVNGASFPSLGDLGWVAIWMGVLWGCGASLILIPVRAVRRRPMTRRSIWFPLIGSGLFAGLLSVGGSLALCEYLRRTDTVAGWAIIVAGAVTWVAWSVLFALIAFSGRERAIGMTLHRWLIAGSVLELLVAVPTHVLVRRRPECCAGFWTGAGICLGVAVMIISFGPSVLLLYYRRRMQITPPQMHSK
jgi:hypothetical protein